MEKRHLEAPVPRITIPMLDRCPEPAAPLSSANRGRMAAIPFLVNFMDGTLSPDRARFWLAYDARGIEITGKLYRPNHGRDDVVESQAKHEQLQLLLSPRRGRWYRIRMCPAGVMAIDGGGGAPAQWWGGEGRLTQVFDTDGWSFAAYIPFSLLGVRSPKPGGVWRFNIFRHEYKRQEDNSSWSVMYLGRTDIPKRYGEVVFGADGVSGGLAGARLLPRRIRASFVLFNGQGKCRVATVEAVQNSATVGRARFTVPPGRTSLRANFDLPEAGVALVVVRSSGVEIARFPLSDGCMALGQRVARLQSALRVTAESGLGLLRKEAESMERGLAKVREAMSRWRQTARAWHRLEAELERLELRASILHHRSQLPDPGATAAVLSTHTLVKIFPGRPLPDGLSRQVKLQAPRRGCDSAQLVVMAFDHALAGCTVDAGPLSAPRGAQLGRDAIEVWRVGSVVTRRPRYVAEYVGAHPDPLLPAQPFTVAKGHFEVLWVTATVPKNARPGRYRGCFLIKPSGCAPLRIPVSLRVWGFELPVRTTLRTAFPMFEREIEAFYRRPLTREQRWLYYDFLLRRRISPSCQYEDEPRPRIEDVGRAMGGGANVVSMGYLQEERLAQWIESLRPTVEFLREKGWLRWAYVYGFDEVTPDRYEQLREAYAAVKAAYPDLKRACTIGPSHELPRIFGTVDIWVPQTDRFEAIYKERQAEGEELWWYVSMWPRHPFANLFVDYPALDHRILFWQTWKYGVTGFLYYCINLWSSNCVGEPSLERETASLPDPTARRAIDRGGRWPQVPWNTYTGPTATNGDGQLIYPGLDGGPLSSVRLECVRHGIEDYEMLARLRQEVDRLSFCSAPEVVRMLKQARGLLRIPARLCRDLTHFSQDPRLLLRTRQRIGSLTERMASVQV